MQADGVHVSLLNCHISNEGGVGPALQATAGAILVLCATVVQWGAKNGVRVADSTLLMSYSSVVDSVGDAVRCSEGSVVLCKDSHLSRNR